jgi:ribosome maturation factor RimP
MIDKDIIDIIESFGVDYYDSEIVNENDNKIFRIYITSSEGVTLEQCSDVTKAISPLLDTNPPVNGKYFLEVSSPGIERKLTKKEHFKHSIGEDVRVTLYSTEQIEGKLSDFRDDEIVVKDEDEEIVIKLEDISKAKTFYRW